MTPLLQATDIPAWRLVLLLLPLAATCIILRRGGLGLERRLVVRMLRGSAQIAALGFVLGPLLGLGSSPWVLGVLALMCCFAAFFSLGLLGQGPGLGLWPLAVAAILPVVVGLTLGSLAAVIPGAGVLEARYALPLAGMLGGVSMNGVALAGERFLAGLSEQRGEIEHALLLGATSREATRNLRAAAVRAAVTPSLNTLAAVGLVSIPGMMAGQVISGGDPLVAARYQILIMGLWISAAALASAGFLHLVPGRVMAGHRLHLAPPALANPAFEAAPAEPPPGGAPLTYGERPPEGRDQGPFSEEDAGRPRRRRDT